MTKPVDLSDADVQCLQMGRSIMLVGLKRAAQILSEQIHLRESELRSTEFDLKQALNGAGEIKPSMQRTLELAKANLATGQELLLEGMPKKRGRPKGSVGVKAYWASMTQEERNAEMRRRRAMRRPPTVKLVQPNHPRNADHPDHAKWVAKMRRVNRRTWNNLTPAARKARIDAAVAGNRKKAAAAR
jgi:hypothetical protein